MNARRGIQAMSFGENPIIVAREAEKRWSILTTFS